MDTFTDVFEVKNVSTEEAGFEYEVSCTSQHLNIHYRLTLQSDEEDAIADENKIRTPSGSLIPKNVSLMTDYFSKKQDIKNPRHIGQDLIKTKSSQSVKARPTQPGQKTTQPGQKTTVHKVNRNIAKKLRTRAKHLVDTIDPSSQNKLSQSGSESDSWLSGNNTSNEEFEEHCVLISNQQQSQQLTMATIGQSVQSGEHQDQDGKMKASSANLPLNTKESPQVATLHPSTTSAETSQMEIEMNDQMNPEVISIQSVMEMFGRLKNEVTGGLDNLSKKVDELQKNKVQISPQDVEQCKNDVMAAVDVSIEEDRKEFKKVKEDLKYFKFRNRALTNVVERMSIEMADIQQRLENVELNTSKNAVSLTGYYMSGPKKDGFFTLEDFFQQSIGVTVTIDDFYRIGSTEPKTTIIYLATSQQKRDVLRFKSYLKDVKNRENRPMYLNDYIPAAVQEKRRREGDIFRINETLPDPVTVEYKKGKLTVAGQIYKQKVYPPSPAQIVDLSPERVDQILKMPLEQGGSVTQDLSVFSAYTTSVGTLQQVQDLYIKMKLIEPSARHIVCAYWIQNDIFYGHDFCDDNEPAAGRAIMSVLLQNNLQNRVIFVARKYGGIRMGTNRFECYKEATKAAINAHPWNDILKINQTLTYRED